MLSCSCGVLPSWMFSHIQLFSGQICQGLYRSSSWEHKWVPPRAPSTVPAAFSMTAFDCFLLDVQQRDRRANSQKQSLGLNKWPLAMFNKSEITAASTSSLEKQHRAWVIISRWQESSKKHNLHHTVRTTPADFCAPRFGASALRDCRRASNARLTATRSFCSSTDWRRREGTQKEQQETAHETRYDE
jgi:hypothetical protein